MSELAIKSQIALDEALAKGLRVIVPEANELYIDIDSEESLREFEKRYELASNLGMVNGYTWHPSKTEGHYHVIAQVYGGVTPLQRLALQAMLGSDWKRELLSYNRLQDGDPIPTLFFEKK